MVLTMLIQLIILFFVIIDPMLSLAVFLGSTKKARVKEKLRIANLSVALATGICFVFLIFGDGVLTLFNTDIDTFRIGGGLILLLLGIRMTLGQTAKFIEKKDSSSSDAIAAIIATPLLAGPACITAIIISVVDYGRILTGLAVLIVLAIAGIMLYLAVYFNKAINKTAVQVTTTMLGLITLSWGAQFIIVGLTNLL